MARRRNAPLGRQGVLLELWSILLGSESDLLGRWSVFLSDECEEYGNVLA